MKFICFGLVFSSIGVILAQPTGEHAAETRTITLDDADKPVDASEQHDPMFQGLGGMSSFGPFGGGMSGMSGYGSQENAVNFDFQCKCKAKSNLPLNLQVPTDANAAAQQQIQQLQDQVRRLNEQVRRTQQGQSNFEQFAQILSMADGLDCNCSGSSNPFTNFPFGGSSTNNQMSGGMSMMGNRFAQQFPFMGGQALPNMMSQRIFPGMFP